MAVGLSNTEGLQKERTTKRITNLIPQISQMSNLSPLGRNENAIDSANSAPNNPFEIERKRKSQGVIGRV